MKKLLTPLLVLTLAVEVTGAGAGGFFCRMMGQRVAQCCCPDAVEALPTSLLVSAGCCEVLEGAAPTSSALLPNRLVVDAPARNAFAFDVPQIAAGDDLPSKTLEISWADGSGPPRLTPIFLSLRHLLI